MEFNNIWTKEVNDQYRKMIIDKKSMDEIREVLGEKMEHHPTKFKYGCKPIIKSYKELLDELKYHEIYTNYECIGTKSKYFDNEYDYSYIFKTDSETIYSIEFKYLQESIGPLTNRNLYNVCLVINDNEKEELIKRYMYIFRDFNNCISKKRFSAYIISDVDNINFYSDIITCSIPLITKIHGDSSINLGKKAWYFIP
jgi:hypothetical protein